MGEITPKNEGFWVPMDGSTFLGFVHRKRVSRRVNCGLWRWFCLKCGADVCDRCHRFKVARGCGEREVRQMEGDGLGMCKFFTDFFGWGGQ